VTQQAISRRELFARFIGRAPAVPEEAAVEELETAPQTLIEKYLALLDRHRDALPFGVLESELPGPREEIKTAIVEALPADAHPALREVLREGYASLVWFTDSEKVACMQKGRRVLDSRAPSEDGKQAVVAAFSIRARTLHEMNLLEREFDQCTPAQLSSDQ
jgi:hypothetical protein